MLKKHGRWYADWETPDGKRKRKTFPTKTAALRFQTAQRNLTATKKARASDQSAKSAKPGPRRTRMTTRTKTAKPRSPSPKSQADSHPTS
jgi:hypothetical protein